MTITEVRNHKEYEVCMNKIKAYRKGFEFTLDWTRIPRPQGNALKIVMEDAKEQGLVESIAVSFSLDGTFTDETYRKL